MNNERPFEGSVAVTKKYTLPVRIWHWASVVAISGSLITVLINATITDKSGLILLIRSELSKGGTNIDDKQAKAVAHAIRDNVWDGHTIFGYFLAGLLFARAIMEFFQPADKKLSSKIRSAYNTFHIVRKAREAAFHELSVKILYGFAYVVLFILAISGLLLAFKDSLPTLKPLMHDIKEIHGFCMYIMIGFIVLHIIGVVVAESKKNRGIVSDMINGGNDKI